MNLISWAEDLRAVNKILFLFNNYGLFRLIKFLLLKLTNKILSYGKLDNFISNIYSLNFKTRKINSFIFDLDKKDEIIVLNKILSQKNMLLPTEEDFYLDTYSNKKIPNIYFSKINFSTADNSGEKLGDFMFANEFNKQKWLVLNIMAFNITHDNKYLDNAINNLKIWRKLFPLGFGVPYITTLNVAQRLINFLIAYNLLLNNNKIDNENSSIKFLKRECIKEFFFLNRHNTINNETKNNYIFCEAAASLLFLKIFDIGKIKNTKLTNKWILATKEAMSSHIDDDGFTREGSIPYSIFILDCLLCIKIIGYKFIDKKILKMFESFYHISDDEYFIPAFGDISTERLIDFDNDNMILSAKTVNDSISNIYKLNKSKGASFTSLSSLLINGKHLNDISKIKPKYGSIIYKNNYVIYSKTWGKLVFDIGDIGLNGRGGHGHCDIGSFVLSDKEIKVIVDPGSYLYSADISIRDDYRSSKKHNILSFNDYEICDLADLFTINNHPKINFTNNSNGFEIALTINNNQIKNANILRKIEINNNGFSIFDSWEPRLNSCQNFFFHPEINLIKYKNEIILSYRSKNIWKILFSVDSSQILLKEYKYSERYGISIDAINLCISFDESKKGNLIEFIKI